jgi:hypothetical protein
MDQVLGKKDEKKRKQNRIIYETLNKDHRIKLKNLSTILGTDRNTTSRKLREAFEQGYVLLPQIRRRSYANMKEYIYFLDCKNPLRSFLEYIKDPNIVYHAVMSGFANLWIISKEKIKIEDAVILQGLRSDFHVAFAPNYSWKEALQSMWKKAGDFNIKTYEPKGTMRTHWDEPIQWDSEDEALFREFKYNLRSTLTPIMRRHLISSDKIYKFLERLPECCTVFTRHFPDSIEAYDPCLFMVETDYEDFIIDLFSELPTSSFFFKASNRLFIYTNVTKEFIRSTELHTDINRLQIPLLLEELCNREILKSNSDALLRYYWGKSL